MPKRRANPPQTPSSTRSVVERLNSNWCRRRRPVVSISPWCHSTRPLTSGGDPDRDRRHSGINQGRPRWRPTANARTVPLMTNAQSNIDTEPGPLPPPLPAPIEPAERRWARSEDRVVLGVAGGLARGLAIDPLFVRIAFVVLA